MNLEILHRPPAREAAPGRPPLLFVHGAFCGAWVWQEHFLDRCAEAGWDCHAVSLRGHGGSAGGHSIDYFGLADYVEDLTRAAAGLDRPPVIIGHSLGGMVAQRYLASGHPAAAMVLMASVPPGGLAGPAHHIALRHPDLLWQIGLMQGMGPQSVNVEVFYRTLFSPGFPRDKALAYFPRFQRESQRATFELMGPHLVFPWQRRRLPTLVMGGDADSFISERDMTATARFHDADLDILPGVPHAVMLDLTWQLVADALLRWLEAKIPVE